MSDNFEKLGKVFSNHNTNFKNTDSVFNVITKKVLDSKFAKLFLIVK